MATAHVVEAHGARIPAIGLGTWQLRGPAVTRAVEAALRSGYRHIDTAEMYDNEAEVGEGLRAAGLPRDQVFVTTKVWWENLGPDAFRRATERSLEKLGLTQVDLLLIHWPNPDGEVERWMEGLCEAKRTGLTKHVGVSNFPTALLERARKAASEPLVVNQCEYHPYLDQTRLIDATRKAGMAFTAYCPLGRGNALCSDTVRAIAGRHGKTFSQVVLRWLIQQPGVVAIPKSGSSQHIAENIDIFDFELSGDEMGRIDALRKPDSRVVDPDFAPAWD